MNFLAILPVFVLLKVREFVLNEVLIKAVQIIEVRVIKVVLAQ